MPRKACPRLVAMLGKCVLRVTFEPDARQRDGPDDLGHEGVDWRRAADHGRKINQGLPIAQALGRSNAHEFDHRVAREYPDAVVTTLMTGKCGAAANPFDGGRVEYLQILEQP